MLGTLTKGVASRFMKIYVLVSDTEKKTCEGRVHLIDKTSLERFKSFDLMSVTGSHNSARPRPARTPR